MMTTFSNFLFSTRTYNKHQGSNRYKSSVSAKNLECSSFTCDVSSICWKVRWAIHNRMLLILVFKAKYITAFSHNNSRRRHSNKAYLRAISNVNNYSIWLRTPTFLDVIASQKIICVFSSHLNFFKALEWHLLKSQAQQLTRYLKNVKCKTPPM